MEEYIEPWSMGKILMDGEEIKVLFWALNLEQRRNKPGLV